MNNGNLHPNVLEEAKALNLLENLRRLQKEKVEVLQKLTKVKTGLLGSEVKSQVNSTLMRNKQWHF